MTISTDKECTAFKIAFARIVILFTMALTGDLTPKHSAT